MVDQQSSTPTTRKVVFKALPLPEAITVGTFAEKMGAEPIQVIKQLRRGSATVRIDRGGLGPSQCQGSLTNTAGKSLFST